MNGERWQCVKQLFSDALKRPAGERAAFLDDACRGDEELRRQVVELLTAHEQVNESVRSSLDSSTNDSAPPSEPPPREVVPGFDLLREISRGGQAIVYLAIQKSTGRRVAVK